MVSSSTITFPQSLHVTLVRNPLHVTLHVTLGPVVLCVIEIDWWFILFFEKVDHALDVGRLELFLGVSNSL